MTLILIILLGWPSAIIGILFIGAGIYLKNQKFRIAGAIISMGFCLYASMYPPPVRWMGLASIAGNWISAMWKWNYSKLTQSLALLPMGVLIMVLGYVVISQ